MSFLEQIIQKPEYQFLNREKNLGKHIMFLTLGGSHAYGTNVEGSDVDVRGVMLSTPESLLGFDKVEQFVHIETDTTVYAFNKFISLVTQCNPNTIELLGNEEYARVSPLGQVLLDNKNLFLSQRASASFNGYAIAQLRRLKNALARGIESQEERETHTKLILEDYLLSLESRYKNFEKFQIEFHLVDNLQEKMEVCCNIQMQDYPVRYLSSVMNELTNITRDADKLGHRNRKKDDLHLNKHAMHLVRLYLMGIDLLSTGKILTYREKDRNLLLNIRHGIYQNKDGSYQNEFFELVNQYQLEFQYAKKHSVLPEKVDLARIEEFMMSVNSDVVKKWGDGHP